MTPILFDMAGGSSLLMLLAIAVPLLAAILLPMFARHPDIRETVSLAAASVLVVLILQLLDVFMAGGRPSTMLWPLIPGAPLRLTLHPLGMIFALVASILWLVTTIYAIGYMRGNKETNQTRFFVCFAIAISATMGIAFASNLFTLFVFYEVLTLSTFPLVTHAGTEKARMSGRLYLGMLMASSMALLLPAIVVVADIAGTTSFTRGGVLANDLSPLGTGILLLMFALGIGKAALMPMHRWLPAAMVAPTPVSALLHAVAVVKAGVFSMVMVVVYIFGMDNLQNLITHHWYSGAWLAYLASFTLVAASIVALRKTNLKARLAYSTIAQLSYVTLGAAVLAPLSLVGAIFHIAAHAVGKITLFFAAGAIYTASKKTEIDQLGGIGKMMPWTMAAFTLASLSMIGLPPTAGFISKWYLLLGSLQAHHYVAVGALIISTVLNAAYLLPIVYDAYFGKATGKAHGEAPRTMVAAIIFTAASTVLLFFCSDTVLQIAGEIVSVKEAVHLP